MRVKAKQCTSIGVPRQPTQKRGASAKTMALMAAIAFGGGCGGGNTETTHDPLGASRLRDVVLVGNSLAGTVSFLDGKTFENLGSINAVPDRQARLAAIYLNPITGIAYTVIKQEQKVKHFEPGGGDRFVDDLFVSPDGRTMYLSRANLGDVAAIDLAHPEHRLLWRSDISGLKADHAALSPDGTRFVVSATTVDKADVFDTRNGVRIGTFPTGNFPHQNDYSADGARIYNSSIGDVTKPYAERDKKGARQLTVADAKTLRVLRTYSFEAGIRPAVFTADEKIMYAQLSYLHGVIKYDLTTGTIVKTLEQPLTDFAKKTYLTPDEYPHDSSHHGLAMSGDGQRLCDADTIGNRVSIIATRSMTVEKSIDTGLVPYWATTTADGKHCLISLSGDNQISIINYETGAELTRVAVGLFPQRTRLARVPESVIAGLSRNPG
jgi:DNA-binding beta-propeller fold protein YncE